MVVDLQYIVENQKEQAARCPSPTCSVHERRIHDLEAMCELQEAQRKAATEVEEKDYSKLINAVTILLAIIAIVVSIWAVLGA